MSLPNYERRMTGCDAMAAAIANVPPRICVHPGFSLLQTHEEASTILPKP